MKNTHKKPRIRLQTFKSNVSKKEIEVKSDEKLISLNIVNTTKTNQKALLFGKNIYLLSPNFGSDVNANISCVDKKISYLQILQHFGDKPIETKLIRLKTKNKEHLPNFINYNTFSANGEEKKQGFININIL